VQRHVALGTILPFAFIIANPLLRVNYNRMPSGAKRRAGQLASYNVASQGVKRGVHSSAIERHGQNSASKLVVKVNISSTKNQAMKYPPEGFQRSMASRSTLNGRWEGKEHVLYGEGGEQYTAHKLNVIESISTDRSFVQQR
jgi:hypothetical protein